MNKKDSPLNVNVYVRTAYKHFVVYVAWTVFCGWWVQRKNRLGR